MARKVTTAGAKPKRNRKPSRAEHDERVGADLDPIAIAEIGAKLLRRLRSTGGRPALADATEFCRVPLSAEDVQALEEIAKQIEQTSWTKPSSGQIASVIVRAYLAAGSDREPSELAAFELKVNEQMAAIAALLPRLAEIGSEASALKERASAVEKSAKEIKEDIKDRTAEVLAMLGQSAK